MSKIRHLQGAAALALMATLTACGSTGNPSASGSSSGGKAGTGAHSKTIIFAPGPSSTPAFQSLAKGVKAYAAAKGYNVIVQDAGQSAQTQLTQIENAIETGQAAGVYAIMLDPKSAAPALQAAQKAGVPMATNGTPSDYGLSGPVPGITFDDVDQTAMGTALGTQLGNCINRKLGGNAEVIQEVDVPGIAGAAQIEASARAALAATAPKAKIVTQVTVPPNVATAQTNMGSALQGHPDAQAVLGNLDEGSLGAIGAYASAGKALQCVVNPGGNAQTLADQRSGKIYAIVALDYQSDLTQQMNSLFTLMQDPTATGTQLTVPQNVVGGGK